MRQSGSSVFVINDRWGAALADPETANAIARLNTRGALTPMVLSDIVLFTPLLDEQHLAAMKAMPTNVFFVREAPRALPLSPFHHRNAPQFGATPQSPLLAGAAHHQDALQHPLLRISPAYGMPEGSVRLFGSGFVMELSPAFTHRRGPCIVTVDVARGCGVTKDAERRLLFVPPACWVRVTVPAATVHEWQRASGDEEIVTLYRYNLDNLTDHGRCCVFGRAPTDRVRIGDRLMPFAEQEFDTEVAVQPGVAWVAIARHCFNDVVGFTPDHARVVFLAYRYSIDMTIAQQANPMEALNAFTSFLYDLEHHALRDFMPGNITKAFKPPLFDYSASFFGQPGFDPASLRRVVEAEELQRCLKIDDATGTCWWCDDGDGGEQSRPRQGQIYVRSPTELIVVFDWDLLCTLRAPTTIDDRMDIDEEVSMPPPPPPPPLPLSKWHAERLHIGSSTAETLREAQVGARPDFYYFLARSTLECKSGPHDSWQVNE